MELEIKYKEIKDGFNLRLEARVKNAELVKARLRLNLTQRKVSEQIGIAETTLCYFENMRRYPCKETQKRICDFYRENGVYIFEEEVFPEELKGVRKKKNVYVIDKEIPKTQLISLSEVKERLLPIVYSDAEKAVYDSELKENFREFLPTLKDNERKVLEYRFGIKDGYPRTLKEVAKMLKIKKERVKMIEARALRNLRDPKISRNLSEFL